MMEALFFFQLLLANHSVMELITICFLPASQNKSIYQRLGSAGLDYSPAVSQLLSLSSNALIDFTRQPPGIIIWHHILHVIAQYRLMPSRSQSEASRSERQLPHRRHFKSTGRGRKGLAPQKSRARVVDSVLRSYILLCVT